MCRAAAEDGRPLRVLYFSDADPSGYQMAISVGRKLAAFKYLLFNDLEYEMHRVALRPHHVAEFGLPSSPLSEKEKRADRWREAWGFDQCEIDSIATLRPDLLRQLAVEAIRRFYDSTLDRRVREAKRAWEEQAQQRLDGQLDQQRLAVVRAEAEEALSKLQDQIDEINSALQVGVDQFELPPVPKVPGAELDDEASPTPVVSSDWACPRVA